MDGYAIPRVYLAFAAFFAAISIPSAYMFGLGIPMRMGLNSLLDSTFFSGEIFKLGLLVIGVLAIMRPLAAFALIAPRIPRHADGDDSNSKWKRWGAWAKFLAVWSYFAFAAFAASSFLLERRLIIPFLLFLSFCLSATILIYVILRSKVLQRSERVEIFDYFRMSMNWTTYFQDQSLLVANPAFVLTATLSLGYLRTITLAL